MPKIILFVFEGARTEPQLFENIKKHFFVNQKDTILKVVFGGEIFQLWNIVKDDEYLDVVQLLQDRDKSNAELSGINHNQVQEIHLFFDHDAHSHPDIPSNKYNKIILEMLETFNDEYERGKLWISYPMVEAIKHCKADIGCCFNDTLYPIINNAKYKEFVGKFLDFQDSRKYTKETWYYFAAINLQRVSALVLDSCLLAGDYYVLNKHLEDKTSIRFEIQIKQCEKFIKHRNAVAVVSPIPLFLLYYFGKAFFDDVKAQNVIKPCSFGCYHGENDNNC